MSFTFKVPEIRIILSNSRISSLIFSSLVTVLQLFATFGLYELSSCKYCQFPIFLCCGSYRLVCSMDTFTAGTRYVTARFQSKLQIIMKRLYVNKSNNNLLVIHCLVQRLLAIGARYHTLINLINKKKSSGGFFKLSSFCSVTFRLLLECGFALERKKMQYKRYILLDTR